MDSRRQAELPVVRLERFDGESFEGPLDLLYHLIEKNEIDLYDIPIAALTDQYLEAIRGLPADMDRMSRFLLMAATLLEIKSKMLLPRPVSGEPEPDPREELVRRLVEYKLFRGAAEGLRGSEGEGETFLARDPDGRLAALLRAAPPPEELLDGCTAAALCRAFLEVMNRKELKTDRIRVGFNSVAQDAYTVESKISQLRNLLAKRSRLVFNALFLRCGTRSEKVATFLALLELIRQRQVLITQEGLFTDIIVEKLRADEGGDRFELDGS